MKELKVKTYAEAYAEAQYKNKELHLMHEYSDITCTLYVVSYAETVEL